MFHRVLLYSALIVTAVGISGCAPIACGTNQCGCALESALGCGQYCGGGNNGCDCGDAVCCGPQGCLSGCTCAGLGRCGICQAAHARLLALRHHQCMIAVGPPAIKYQPQMPPEFLPVPTQPIVANVNTNAPVEMRGSVDAGWGHYFVVEPHD